MFLSIREIRHAKGRFTLIGSVIALMTLLVVMLTGLTEGLGKQNTAALESLHPDKVVFAAPSDKEKPEASFSSSSISEDVLAQVKGESGVEEATPLGTTQTRMEGPTGAQPVAVLGMPEGTQLPEGRGTVGDGVVVSKTAAEETGVSVGSSITLGGQNVQVKAIAEDSFYSHSPVVWADTATWQDVSHAKPGTVGTAVLVTGSLDGDIPGTVSTNLRKAFDALPGYASEHGSLVSMQGFLYGISALVTVSFLTVWTLQRTREISVLAALGASKRYLFIDALTQAAIVLGIGALIGALLGAGLGALAQGAVPFELSAFTVLAPAVIIWLLGLVGSALAVRKVTKVDPQRALAAA